MLGEWVEIIEWLEDEFFFLWINWGIEINVLVICIVGGLGCFEFCKLFISNLV